MGQPGPDAHKYFNLNALRSEAMRSRLAMAMWAERVEKAGLMGASSKLKDQIRRGIDEVLDNVILYLEDS